MAKWAAAIGFGAAALWLVPASAETSSDLVFCSRLTNPRERIACYDAAARIAERRPARAHLSTAPSAAPVGIARVEAIQVAVVPANQFHGFYVAGGGSFGWGTPRSFDVSSAMPAGFSTTFPGTSGSLVPHGWSGAATTGYNLTHGPLLVGLELSGRHGSESAEGSGINDFQTFAVAGRTANSFRFNVDAGVHVSGRLGLSISDSMLFAKAGIGTAHVTQKGEQIGSGFLCASASPATFICLTQTPVPSIASSGERWLPSMLIGIGAERNFGSWFARVDAEVEAITGLQNFRNNALTFSGLAGAPGTSNRFDVASSSPAETFWTSRIVGMVGLRF